MGLGAGIRNLGLGSESGTEYWGLGFGTGDGDLELGAGTGAEISNWGLGLGTGAGISKWGLVLGIWIRGFRGRVKELEVEYKVYLLGNGL